jgi:hypothetical protein
MSTSDRITTLQPPSRRAFLVSFPVVLGACFAYGFYHSAVDRIPASIAALLLVVSSLAFFSFAFRISDDRSLPLTQRLSRFAVHSMLTLGFGFFIYIFHDANRSILYQADVLILLFLVLVCFSIGVFVYYFFNICSRIDVRLGHLTTAICALVACFVVALVAQVPFGVTLLYALAAVVIFCGIYPYIIVTSRLIDLSVVAKFKVDVYVLTIGFMAYFSISYLLIKKPDRSISETMFLQVVVLLFGLSVFVVIDSSRAAIRWWRARRKSQQGAQSGNSAANLDESNFVLYVLRYLVGPISNFSILLSPISLISYVRYFMFLDRLDRHAGKGPTRIVKFSATLAVGAALIYLLMLPIFTILVRSGVSEPASSAARGIIFAAAGAIAWVCLASVDQRDA